MLLCRKMIILKITLKKIQIDIIQNNTKKSNETNKLISSYIMLCFYWLIYFVEVNWQKHEA